MSPLTTLISCGSSSIESRRMIRPTFVTRGSSRILNRTPLPSLRPRRSSRRASASTTIERNLSIVNSRPSTPTRVWRNSAGPLLVSRMAAATTSMNGSASRRIAPPTVRSNAALPSSRPPRAAGRSRCSRERPAIGRIDSRGPGDLDDARRDDELDVPLLQRPRQAAQRVPGHVRVRDDGDDVRRRLLDGLQHPARVTDDRDVVDVGDLDAGRRHAGADRHQAVLRLVRRASRSARPRRRPGRRRAPAAARGRACAGTRRGAGAGCG